MTCEDGGRGHEVLDEASTWVDDRDQGGVMTDNLRDLDRDLVTIPIFGGLSRRKRAMLLDMSKVVDHDIDHEVATQGEGALALHLVLEGRASVRVGGSEVRQLGPGEYFGEISMIDGKRRSATVLATEPLRTLAVPHLAFRDVVMDDPESARELLLMLCDRLREAESR
jgi:CRP/FNR family cyclic AMP-dependent transcriptional regulator